MPIRGRGRGLPDWSREIKYPTLLPPKQKLWTALIEYRGIYPFGFVATEVYTVPTGYKLILKRLTYTMTGEQRLPLNTWNKIEVKFISYSDGEAHILLSTFFLRVESYTFIPSQEVKEGDILHISMWNNSSEYANAIINVVGVLESLRGD